MSDPASTFRPLTSLLQLLLLGLFGLLPAGGWIQAQTASNANFSTVRLPASIPLLLPGADKPVTIQPARLLTAVRVDDLTPRCASDAFELPGQAWDAGLSSGGITLKAGSKAGQTITPQERAAQLSIKRPNSPGTVTQGKEMVTLLVIDNFQPVPVKLDEDGLTSGSQPAVEYQLRHGELVLAHIRSVLQGGGFRVGLDKAVRADRTIVFEKLDIGKLLPDTALKKQGGVDTGRIREELARLEKGRSSLRSGPLVVNMSFALIPCNLQSVYIQFRDAALDKTPPLRLTFSDFLKAVADANLPTTPTPTPADEQAYLVNLFTHLRDNDPLLNAVSNMLRGRAALAVASSGNYAQSFETMPAAWPPTPLSGTPPGPPPPPVLGVGATDKNGKRLTWPDTSDVLEVGEWFRFASLPSNLGCFVGTDCIFKAMPLGTQPSTATFAYKGTSFSSPTVAAALASRIPLTPGAVGPSDPCFTVDALGFLRLRSGPGQPAVPKLNQLPFRPLFAGCR